MWTAVTGFLGTNRLILIGAAIAVVLAFGIGWGTGASHIARINSQELAVAAERARVAQSKKDAEDYAAAKADMEKRHAEELARNFKIKEIIRVHKVKVVVPGECAVTPEAMKLLNDPSIIGAPH